ncbi:MAG TPA: hypothetical protein ENO24_00440, partial [Chloroflexi bacterium]|nr:hypothetical protein [Chloroflexota bacterium]
MPRLIIPLLFLGLALSSWLAPGALVPADEPAPLVSTAAVGAELENREGLPVLHLGGSPYEIGYQHGSLLREQIRAGIHQQVYAGLVRDKGIPHILLLCRAREIEALLPEEYRQEMKGLADGAGLSYLQILALNSAHELAAEHVTATGVRQLMLSASPRFDPHFSSTQGAAEPSVAQKGAAEEQARQVDIQGAFAAFGSATSDGRMLQAAWFSAPAPELNDVVVIVCRPDSGNSYVGLGKPGAVGILAGLNEEGLVVTALGSPSQDTEPVGIPAPILLREVLQHGGGLSTALNFLTSAQRTGGHNVLIGDGKRPDAQALEFSAHQFSVFPAENDLIARTRHYLDAELGQTQYA